MVKGFVEEVGLDKVLRKDGKPQFSYAPRIGTSDPVTMLMSFCLEREIRERWWHIKNGDVVIDIGAGVGSYSFPALADGATVFAFEPSKCCLFDLMANSALNGFLGRFYVLPFLVGDKIGTTDYWPDTHSSLTNTKHGRHRRAIITLDWFCSAHTITKLDWIKIDVEGAEVSVLKGAKEALGRLSPNLLIENHVAIVPNVLEEIRDILVPLGYVEENYCKSEGSNENWSRWSRWSKENDVSTEV